jgi:glutamate 5-kinase
MSAVPTNAVSPAADLLAEDPIASDVAIRLAVAAAKRVVIKLGTNVVMRPDGAVAVGRLYSLVESIATLRHAGREVVVVSSGAVGLGAERLRLDARAAGLATKQACAAVGQSRLMALYQDAFERLGMPVAQVLLTEDDFIDAERYQNLRAALETLLSLGVVPIVNENDTVSTLELERPHPAAGERGAVFGDNDKLSALVAGKIGAGLLLLLSDVDGLYTGHPSLDAQARLIPLVREITPELLAAANDAGCVVGGMGQKRSRGRGGMASKLDAARLATSAGAFVVIANGRTPGIVDRVCEGGSEGTVFIPEDRS